MSITASPDRSVSPPQAFKLCHLLIDPAGFAYPANRAEASELIQALMAQAEPSSEPERPAREPTATRSRSREPTVDRATIKPDGAGSDNCPDCGAVTVWSNGQLICSHGDCNRR